MSVDARIKNQQSNQLSKPGKHIIFGVGSVDNNQRRDYNVA